MVVPYSIWVSLDSLVVQLMVTPVEVMLVEVTAVMTGAVVSGGASVVNVKSADVVKFPDASFDLTL
mgnify:CR=1 FL=1